MFIDHPDVIRLCTTCRRYRCPGICDEYRETVRRIQSVEATVPIYTAYGKSQTLKQWSMETGINYVTLYDRINRQGMTMEQAI